jgi:hypothetical protein
MSATYESAADLSAVLRRAAAAHGLHEKEIGRAGANWPDWYAQYTFNEQSGQAGGGASK